MKKTHSYEQFTEGIRILLSKDSIQKRITLAYDLKISHIDSEELP